MSYAYEQNRKAKKIARKLNPAVDTEVEKVEKVKKEVPVNKTYRVTYSDNKKFNPSNIEVLVKTTDKATAQLITHQQFGSITLVSPIGWPRLKFPSAPSSKITIISCDEIDSEGNIIPEVVTEAVVEEKKPRTPRKKKVAVEA
jgi:hypothetical protein